METEREAAEKRGGLPGKDRAGELALTNLDRVAPFEVSGAELGRLAVEAAPRTGGFTAAELIATHLQGAGLEVNSNFGIEAGSEEELIWVDGIVGLALFETPLPTWRARSDAIERASSTLAKGTAVLRWLIDMASAVKAKAVAARDADRASSMSGGGGGAGVWVRRP